MPDFVIKKKKKKDYVQFTCRIEPEILETVKRTVLDYNLPSIITHSETVYAKIALRII